MKKIILTLGAIGAVLAIMPLFAAFEAHVVNVTATIENALSVPLEAEGITYGTVFPEQVVNKTVGISLSQSFLGSGNVNANMISYVIKQKPKCGLPVPTSNPVTYSAFAQASENADHVFICPQNYVILPLLCPYLSKTSSNQGDTSVSSFHGPTSTQAWTDLVSTQYEAQGTLAKGGPTSADWTIDLHTPCFAGSCAQDWPTFVKTANSSVIDPNAYMADPSQQHQMFGCDLWFETTAIGQTVGANLSAYTAPLSCDVTVNSSVVEDSTHSHTINGGIALASTGQTVCVKAGTYNEDVNVNKSITLAGDGPTLVTLTGVGTGEPGALVVTADNVTVEGFKVIGTGVSAMRISGAHTGDNFSFNDAVAATGKNAFLTDGGQSNHTISNNLFEGNGSQLVYVNGNASVTTSTNVDFVSNTFGGTATGPLLGIEANGSSVSLNKFSGTTSYTSIENWEGNNLINQNNFDVLNQMDVNNSVLNGKTHFVGTLNAENNWWGDTVPANNVTGLVNFTPFQLSAFPEY